jgi:hypothetical protein
MQVDGLIGVETSGKKQALTKYGGLQNTCGTAKRAAAI